MSDKLRPDPKKAYPYQAQYGALHAMPQTAMARDQIIGQADYMSCLLYTSDAADE